MRSASLTGKLGMRQTWFQKHPTLEHPLCSHNADCNPVASLDRADDARTMETQSLIFDARQGDQRKQGAPLLCLQMASAEGPQTALPRHALAQTLNGECVLYASGCLCRASVVCHATLSVHCFGKICAKLWPQATVLCSHT